MSTNNYAAYGKWGPGVLGEEEYARQQAVLKSGAHKYGPGVVDPVNPVSKAVNVLAGDVTKMEYNDLRKLAAEKGLKFDGTPNREQLVQALTH